MIINDVHLKYANCQTGKNIKKQEINILTVGHINTHQNETIFTWHTGQH